MRLWWLVMVHPVKKKDLAGSISSVKLDDSPLTQLANVNALVALSSKIPVLIIPRQQMPVVIIRLQ